MAAAGALAVPLAASAPPAEARTRTSAVERAVIDGINAVRREHGLSRLRPSRRLAAAARVHSRDMSRHWFFSHRSGNGTRWSARVRRFVPSPGGLGETIAWVSGPEVPRRTVQIWMRSPAHRATLLDRSFRRIGVAVRTARGVSFVTADLSTGP